MHKTQEIAGQLSKTLNSLVEKIIGVLMIFLLLDVWVGVLDRYFFDWQIAWVEEIARYLMIWVTLLAVSCGISRRDHIGLFMILNRFSSKIRIVFLSIFDLITIIFFMIVFYTGLDFANSGLKRYIDSIFGVSMFLPYLSIPVFAFLSIIQTLLVFIRDFGNIHIYDLDYREESK